MLIRKTKVELYSDRNMNSSNCRNYKLKKAGITETGQEYFHCQLRIEDELGFIQKR